jgi:acyl-CoA thioesterase FadM
VREQDLSQFINFVRIPALAIRQHLSPLRPLEVLHEDVLQLRVWPNDIDLNMHMNNARYLSVMDYARTHLLARIGMLEHIVRSRWQPLVGAVWLTYRRPLTLFSRFTLTSRIVCWDERWFYIEQTFANASGQCAIGWVKGALRNKQGTLDPQTVIERVAPGTLSREMPDTLAAWNQLTREKLQKDSQ